MTNKNKTPLEIRRDAICASLAAGCHQEGFPAGSAGLACAGLISAIAEHYDVLPRDFLSAMFPSLAMLYQEVVENSIATNNLIDRANNE